MMLGAQRTMGAPPGGGAAGVIGGEKQMVVSGCTHGTVGSIVRGAYTLNGQNHGKPTYKKDAQVNGLDVMLYFWDERDGAAFSGWWFGPKVGGDQVWAYHPSNTPTPSRAGWKVPYDGPVDHTMALSPKSGAPAAVGNQAWGGKAGAGQLAMQAPGQQAAQPWAQQGQQAWQNGAKGAKGGKDAKGKGKDAKGKGKVGGWQAPQMQAPLPTGQNNVAKMQQLQQQQQELKNKAAEEKKKHDEEAAKKRVEQGAALNIRRIIQKVRSATEQNLEQFKTELGEVMAKELEACGSMKDKIQEESDKAVEQTKTRLETTKKAKAEAEEKRKVAQEKAEGLLKQMSELVADAEKAAAAVKEAAEPLKAGGLKEVTKAAAAIEKTSTDAKEKLKLCTDFIKENGKDMVVAKAEGETDIKAEWGKLMTKTNESARATDSTVKAAAVAKVKAEKKAEADKKLDAKRKVFDKYDKDKDGHFSKAEVKAYAKDVFKFAIAAGPLDEIFAALAEGPKGIKKESLQRLKVAVGCAREKEKDDELRKTREAKEKRIADIKATLQEKVKAVLEVVEKSEGLVKKAEQSAQPLVAKAKELASVEMVKLADEVEASIKEAKDDVAETKTKLESLKEGVEEDLKAWMLTEAGKLESKAKRWEPRLARATSGCSSFREMAKSKERAELDALERRVVGMIKFHQQEGKLSKDEMFAAFDSNKDGKVSEAEFVKFFATCKKEEPNENGKVTPKKDPPSEAELARVFKLLDEDGEGSLSKDRLGMITRKLMKVAAEAGLSSGKSISDKDSKTLRRMEVNEVVEVLEGPIEDDSAGVMRVRAVAVKDGVEGWATLKGNQGTLYLKDGGSLYKVVKETIMTPHFELDAEADKEKDASAKDPTRKLKAGELLEVREHAKKEETSGLTRMKCKAKSDGLIGWVTTIGNAGTVFVSVL